MIRPFKAVAFSFVVGAVGAMALVSAPACSGGGSICGAASKCSADPAPTQTAIDQCNKLSSGACGSQYTALGNCALAQQKCAADNTTDANATGAAVLANCSTQFSAYQTCCQNNASACQ